MRRRVFIAIGLCVGVLMAGSVVVPLEAQKKEEKPSASSDRVEGNVQSIDKATKTVAVRLRGKTTSQDVVFSDTTSFTFRNKPATLEEVKDGRHVICLGKLNDKNQLIATRIDVRDEK